jgi:superfamily I DNA and RNA helicase
LLVNRLNKKYKDIFVVVPTDKEVKSLKTKLTNRIKDIKIQILKVDKNENTTFDDENTINIGTIESIKGLDCPIVLLLLKDSIFIQRSPETISNAIYTVINRAMHLLQIFMPDELTENENPCIENLVYLLRNGDFKDEELPKYTYKFIPKDIIEIDGQKFLKGCYNNEQGKISEEVLLRRYNKDINYFLNYCDSLIVQDSYTNTEELYPLFYEKKTVSTKIYKK